MQQIRRYWQSAINSHTLLRCESIWGEHAFKRPEGNGWRDQLLAGMYDAQMLSVSQLSQQQYQKAVTHKRAVLQNTRTLFDDTEFDKAVRTGTNTPARITYRVDQMRDMLKSF